MIRLLLLAITLTVPAVCLLHGYSQFIHHRIHTIESIR